MHFSFLIRFNNLSSTCIEQSDYSSSEGSYCTRAVRKVSSHFEYLENSSRGLDVTWQPVREDLTVDP